MASVLGAISTRSARSQYDTTLTLGHPRGRRNDLVIDLASLSKVFAKQQFSNPQVRRGPMLSKKSKIERLSKSRKSRFLVAFAAASCAFGNG
jgi:hypothetical protein